METLRKSLSEALGRVQQNNLKLRKGYGKTERGDEDGLPPMRLMSNLDDASDLSQLPPLKRKNLFPSGDQQDQGRKRKLKSDQVSLFAYSSIEDSGGTGGGALNSRNALGGDTLNPMLLKLNFQDNKNFHSQMNPSNK